MWDDADPTPKQIHKAFLEFVEKFHAAHNYTSDFAKLARSLGVRVGPANYNKAFIAPDGEPRILLDATVSTARLRFTGLHEIAHHLFWRAFDGELKAYLGDYFYKQPDVARQFEEDYCYEAAALLLMPTHVMQACVNAHLFSPLAVFALAEKTGASHQAAMRRVIYAHDIPVHALLVSPEHRVIDSISYGKKRSEYYVGKDFTLEPQHPLVCGSYIPGRLERFRAPVPFKGGNREWVSNVLAARESNTSRILAFFLDSYPPNKQLMQALF